jgi:methyl-accepting chemotaxis protein
MTHTIRRAVLLILAATLLPMAAAAQARSRPAPPLPRATNPEVLDAQERELLIAANDFARRCGEAIEKWLAGKEINEDRLFSYLYYPQPNTDPVKFTSEWDRLSDRDLQAIEEAVLAKSPTIIYAVFVDKNGYLPTHNRRFAQPLTGNHAVDLVNNRSKRIFDDQVGIAAARNEAAFLFQRYQRDTGEITMDLSVPVNVRGQHFGAVRIGYRPVEGQ